MRGRWCLRGFKMAIPFFEVISEKPVQPVDDPYGTNAEVVFGTYSVPLADMYPESTHSEEPTVGIPETEEGNSAS